LRILVLPQIGRQFQESLIFQVPGELVLDSLEFLEELILGRREHGMGTTPMSSCPPVGVDETVVVHRAKPLLEETMEEG